jgi:predicted AlkP superfamily phosphohydrolase/phosphomutase
MKSKTLVIFIFMALIFIPQVNCRQVLSAQIKNNDVPRDKIVLIGIDGATWRVMQPLLEEGKLPNIERLIKEGCQGVLSGEEPFLSPVIWTSIATGKKPSKHGITDFRYMDVNNFTFNLFTSSHRKTKAFWNILSDYGLSVGLVYWWTSWPAEKVNGYIVSDYFQEPNMFIKGLTLEEMISSGTEDLTYPKGLFKLLQKHRRTRAIPSEFSYQGRKGISYQKAQFFIRQAKSEKIDVSELRKMLLIYIIKTASISQDIRTFLDGKYLLRKLPTDLFAMYLEGADIIQHFLWEFYEPAKECNYHTSKEEIDLFGQVIPLYYQWYDNKIGELLDSTDKEKTTVIIVSDHGFHAFCKQNSYTLFINTILEKLGWLRFEGEKILWPETIAYQPTGSAHLYIRLNLHGRDPGGIVKIEEYDAKRLKLRNELLDLKTEDGKKLFLDVEMIDNQNGANSADLEFKINTPLSLEDKLIINGERLPLKKFMLPFIWGGDHEQAGVIIMSGNHIKKGEVIKEATSYDVTPTILALLGIPIGEDMDGKVLTDAIEEDFLKRKPPRFINSHDAGLKLERKPPEDSAFNERMIEKLRAIGYLQ